MSSKQVAGDKDGRNIYMEVINKGISLNHFSRLVQPGGFIRPQAILLL